MNTYEKARMESLEDTNTFLRDKLNDLQALFERKMSEKEDEIRSLSKQLEIAREELEDAQIFYGE